MSFATLSIDWEDFGQLYGMYHYGKITPPVDGAIERQTGIMLNMLERQGVKATFFVLGMLAQYRPELVKEIQHAGHEIALHGQNHRAMFTLSPEEAIDDIRRNYDIVAQITGEKIYGYRAPFFSINESNLYLLEFLADLGLTYDSSIFPKKMSRYGIEGFSVRDCLYSLPGGKELVELPLTLADYFGKQWPVAGGGYIRLMPKPLVAKVFSDFGKLSKDSMIYMHPYEFDSKKISVATNYPPGESRTTIKVHALNLRWNIFRSSVGNKIESLLGSHQFITCLQKADNVKKNGIRAELLGRA